MDSRLKASQLYCRRLARRRARNFYYAFHLLEPEQRNAVCAIYAFMRACDDISDEPGLDLAVRRQRLEECRVQLSRALSGDPAPGPFWPAFSYSVHRFGIPPQYFFDLIEGVASDLEPRVFRTFEELYRYCYSVASVAGLALIHVLGFSSPEALVLAEKCGVAFQLTNILRDVREDALRGRVYFPEEDLLCFQLARQDILELRDSPRFRSLAAYEASRARTYYEQSAPLLELVEPRNRDALWALVRIYRRLLERIEESGFDVLARRIQVPVFDKVAIATLAMARAAVH